MARTKKQKKKAEEKNQPVETEETPETGASEETEPAAKEEPKEEAAEEETKEESRELPIVDLRVFKAVSGIKPDQIVGFESFAKREKLKPRTIPEWHDALAVFLSTPTLPLPNRAKKDTSAKKAKIEALGQRKAEEQEKKE